MLDFPYIYIYISLVHQRPPDLCDEYTWSHGTGSIARKLMVYKCIYINNLLDMHLILSVDMDCRLLMLLFIVASIHV